MTGKWWEALASLPERFGRITASGTYVPQIDGLRFLAIIQVVIFHAALRGGRAVGAGLSGADSALAFFPNGAAGVELFFFISGYIISYPFLSGRAPSLKKFFRRRLLRLEPPYMIIIVFSFVFLSVTSYAPTDAVSFNKSSASLGESFAASILYLNGIIFHAPPRLNPPLWSLEVEIQFYILAPFILKLYMLVKDLPKRITIGLIFVLAGIYVQAVLTPNAAWHYILPANCYAFFLGIVASDLAISKDPFKMANGAVYDFLLIIGLALFLTSSSLVYAFDQFSLAGLNILARAVGIWLIYAGASRGIVGRSIFGYRWLTLIGGACYSIYLTHIPVLQLTSAILFRVIKPTSLPEAVLIAICVLVPASAISGFIYYLVVERPCMRMDWPQRLWAKLNGARA